MNDDTQEKLRHLGRRLHEFSGDLAALDRLPQTDVPSALNKIRFITERVLHKLCRVREVSWGDAEPTLERMVGPLVSSGVLPKSIAIHVRTVQSNASPGSHYQDTPLAGRFLQIAREALTEFLTWYDKSEPGHERHQGYPKYWRAPCASRWSRRLSTTALWPRVLTKAGHTVMSAASGRGGLAALRDGFFDLIFVQVQMHELDGFEVTTRIRQKEKGSGHSVLIFGMTSDAAYQERCLGAGLDGFVCRPVNVSELLSVVDRLAESIDLSSRLFHQSSAGTYDCSGNSRPRS